MAEEEDKGAVQAPTLEDAHNHAIAGLENEDGDTQEVKPNIQAEEKPGEATGEDGAGEHPPQAEEEPRSTQDPFPTGDPTKVEIPEVPELNTDIKAPADNKVMVKDIDGETYFFNSIDEVPNDFEPANAKEWGQAVQKMADNVRAREELKEQSARAQGEQLRLERAQEIRSQWQAEQQDLVNSGDLPKDEKERQAILDGVMGVINGELEKGRAVGSWTQAYEMYQFRQSKETHAATKQAEKEAIDKQNKLKSERGSKIQSGGQAAPSGRPTVREGIPTGTTLDQVHAAALMDLNNS